MRSEFDPALLPREGAWRGFHDFYWPPDCFVGDSGLLRGHTRCSVCPAETLASEFARFTRYFEELARIAEEQIELPEEARTASPTTFDWGSIKGRWEDCKRRGARDRNSCSMEQEWVRKFFKESLKEIDAATRNISIADVRRFLALPYWKLRWQFYEVWFVTILLRSYGLSNLILNTDGPVWTLAVGSVSPKPIAVSNLANGDRLEFYYQHQGIPPSALFKKTADRPEVLVRRTQAGGGHRMLMAAEVKAKKSFGTQEMKQALFTLQEWDPEAIVGVNYFPIKSGTTLSKLNKDAIEIVAADECTPRSSCSKELFDWLAEYWPRKLGEFISVLLIDTSGSMPERLIPSAISYARAKIKASPTSKILVATFNDAVRFYPPDALDRGSVDVRPSGGTALSNAVNECRAALVNQYPSAGQVAVHVITDLQVGEHEIRDLIEWARSKNTLFRVYTWRNGDVAKLMGAEPELTRLVELLPS